jgi:hypothetical protein
MAPAKQKIECISDYLDNIKSGHGISCHNDSADGDSIEAISVPISNRQDRYAVGSSGVFLPKKLPQYARSLMYANILIELSRWRF